MHTGSPSSETAPTQPTVGQHIISSVKRVLQSSPGGQQKSGQGGPAHWQLPSTQVRPAEVSQALPQVPQLFTSVSTFVHSPPHLTSPALGHPAEAQVWVTGMHLPEVG
jgi:hypothetical protein